MSKNLDDPRDERVSRGRDDLARVAAEHLRAGNDT